MCIDRKWNENSDNLARVAQEVCGNFKGNKAFGNTKTPGAETHPLVRCSHQRHESQKGHLHINRRCSSTTRPSLQKKRQELLLTSCHIWLGFLVASSRVRIHQNPIVSKVFLGNWGRGTRTGVVVSFRGIQAWVWSFDQTWFRVTQLHVHLCLRVVHMEVSTCI